MIRFTDVHYQRMLYLAFIYNEYSCQCMKLRIVDIQNLILIYIFRYNC